MRGILLVEMIATATAPRLIRNYEQMPETIIDGFWKRCEKIEEIEKQGLKIRGESRESANLSEP